MFLKAMYPFLFIFIFHLTFEVCFGHDYSDTFDEHLLIKPLQSGHVYTQFKFVVEEEIHPLKTSFKHFRLFPRSLGEIISRHSVQELHLSLTQGFWRYEKWGYPYRDAPPGAELWIWFKENTEDVSAAWKNVVNVLSGQFCASLNFIDATNTVSPKLSFKPQGAVILNESYNSSYLRHASLPREIVCTENLTPFKKLLPCDTKAGLSTLLTALNLFNSHFVSLAIDFQTVCKTSDCSKRAIQLTQSVAVVFEPTRLQSGRQDWSFVKLFSTNLANTCPVSTQTKVYVDISLNKSHIPFSLTPESPIVYRGNLNNSISFDSEFAVYDIKEILKKQRSLNIAANYQRPHIYGINVPPAIYTIRQITGYGQERGGFLCKIHYHHSNKPLKIVYFEVIPWFLRIYTHTLLIKSGNEIIKPDFFYYKPAKDRERPHHLELVLTLPPESVTQITMDFDYAFLKWTEYPPDANHGFYVGSSVISTYLDWNENFTSFLETSTEMKGPYFLRVQTKNLLVSLPTPDFSMPYNVICLVCTVVALAFGPIHNITTKRLMIDKEEAEGTPSKLKRLLKKCYTAVFPGKKVPVSQERKESASQERKESASQERKEFASQGKKDKLD